MKLKLISVQNRLLATLTTKKTWNTHKRNEKELQNVMPQKKSTTHKRIY